MTSRVSAGQAWTAVALAFLFMLINFADKTVLGLASVPIMRDLGLDHRQFGLLGSAFFLLFSASGIAVGFLSNRMGTRPLMLGMAVVWAVALLLPGTIPAFQTFQALLVSRIVLGAAEGPAFPIAMHSIYKWFVDEARTLPTSVVASGAAFGSGLVAPLITAVIARWGWHGAFAGLGLVGLSWAGIWWALAREGPLSAAPAPHAQASTRVPAGHASARVRADAPPRVPYRRLLSSRTVLGVLAAGFAAYWIIALNLVWLANYLIKALHFAPAQAAWVIALPAVLQMVLAPACAQLSRILTRRGVSSRVARGVLGAAMVILAGIGLMCLPFAGSRPLQTLLVGLSFSLGSVIFTLGTALIGEISPVAQRGAMLGITNSVHTLAGLIAPFVMGWLVDVNADPVAGFGKGFVYAGVLVALLGTVAALLIDPGADIRNFNEHRKQ